MSASEGRASAWSHYTGEQEATHAELLANGIVIIVNSTIAAFSDQTATLSCLYSGTTRLQHADALVMMTFRKADDALLRAPVGEDPALTGLRVEAIGDCVQPALIAHAVYAGHKAARLLGVTGDESQLARDRLVV